MHVMLQRWLIRSAGLAAFLVSYLGQAAPLEGRVIHVGDGDSLTVCVNHVDIRVRLIGIDAPEYRQSFGRRSRASLAELCAGKIAQISGTVKDRYGRTLARLSCGGIDVNAEQVRRGMAWVSDLDEIDKDLSSLQEQARAARLGLWSEPSPVPPWQWRRAHRGEDKWASSNLASQRAAECRAAERPGQP